MYQHFYGLAERPFSMTPDPRFLHLTAGHREALAQLVYGVGENKGFLLLTGEVGTGKTTLLRALMQRLADTAAVAFVFDSSMPFDALLEYVLEDFGIATRGLSRAQRLVALNHFLIERQRAGQSAVVILDEAQNLDLATLEQIRLLSNFETAREKLLQFILVGQPELRAKLRRPELRQLYQRIGLRCRIDPLSPTEVRECIVTRLRIAGARETGIFSEEAIRRIAQYSRGVPRVVNVLCDHCLLIGYADQRRRIDRDIVEQGIAYLEAGEGRRTRWARRARPGGPRGRARAAWLVGAAATAGAAGLAVLGAGGGELESGARQVAAYVMQAVDAARTLVLP
jgi:type II secretory pathway predicted ATPase ExeA